MQPSRFRDNTAAKLIFVILFVAVVVMHQAAAFGQGSAPEKKPSDYIYGEFLVGSLLGGIAGSEILEFQIRNYFCSGIDDPQEFNICRAGTLASARPTLYPLLILSGASLGIWGMAALNNVEGNLFAMFTGTMTGALTGAAIMGAGLRLFVDWLLDPATTTQIVEGEGTPELIKRIFPVLTAALRNYETELKKWSLIFSPAVFSAFWGTVGFNIGSKFIGTSR